MKKFVRFMFGVVIGAFMGSLLAILLTPTSGSDIRSRITGETLRLRDEIEQAAASKRTELEKELADLRKNIVIN